ncbi:MAG: hypothetical protein FD138_2891 [Planctomycetota bacterium]|nr:MAG: hypothetical protein FD138_2891 [Planctomycetota bacterium]
MQRLLDHVDGLLHKRSQRSFLSPLLHGFQVELDAGQRLPDLVVQFARQMPPLGLLRAEQLPRQRFQPLTARGQLFIGTFAFRDVLPSAQNAGDISCGVVHWQLVGFQPDRRPLGQRHGFHNSQLRLIGLHDLAIFLDEGLRLLFLEIRHIEIRSSDDSLRGLKAHRAA